MTAVIQHNMTQQAAAELFGIPRPTLADHLNKGSIVKRMGRHSIMNETHEKVLVSRLIKLANSGKTVTPHVICKQAFLFCEKFKLKHNFNVETRIAGKKWLKRFLKRHPVVSHCFS